MDGGGVYLVAGDGGLHLAQAAGLSADFVAAAGHYAADAPNTRLVMAGEPVYRSYLDRRVSTTGRERREGLRAVAVIPIRHEGRVIGCLRLASRHLDEVPRHSRLAIETIAPGLGLVISRAQADEALRASEERYRAVVEDQTEVISRFAVDGTFTFVNDVFCRFFGRRADELLGRKWQPVAHPEDLPRIEAQLRRLSPLAPVVTIENRVLSGSGELRWMQFVNRGFFDARGRLVETQSVGRDITERKALEETLRQREQEARQFLRRLLEAREAERREVAATLHHEVGSSAVGVSARLQAVDTALCRRRSREARELLTEAVTMLDHWHGRLKALASDLRPPDLDLLGLPAALRTYFTQATAHTPVRVEFRCQGDAGRIPARLATPLFRVAQESLTNALRHAGARRVRVSLSVTPRGVRLRVTDDGAGFDVGLALAADVTHVGLRAMREMVTAQGGRFAVESVPGKGTTVRAVVPLPQGSFREG